jgi:transcriptional regulator with XRE-family HTH domain
MNREDFGQLVAALRQDVGWIQFQLAEYADVDEAVISQIERGVKKHFEPDLLFRLANALQLTTLERREFILAASGLEERQIVRQTTASMKTDAFNSGLVLDRMLELTASIRQPAFLCDVYGDVVAANHTMLSFYKIPQAMFESAPKVAGGYNAIRVNFGGDLVSRGRVTDNWDNYALNSMRSFRVNSLRYRAQPYFKYLMKHFRNPNEYPLFDRYWKLVSSTEQDKETNVDQFDYNHSEFGPLSYLASNITAITSFGELILIQNVPLDEDTDRVFTQLKSAVGEGIVRFAPWPEKPML